MTSKLMKNHLYWEKLSVSEFVSFISDNINLNEKKTIFKKEMKYFFDYYYRFFLEEEISIRDMLHLYMRTVDTKILYIHRDDSFDRPREIDDYRREYTKMNNNVFEVIKKTYLKNIENSIIDEDIEKRFFYISLIDIIWVYICKKINDMEWKENISKYWNNFFVFLKKNIHRINSKTHSRMRYGI